MANIYLAFGKEIIMRFKNAKKFYLYLKCFMMSAKNEIWLLIKKNDKDLENSHLVPPKKSILITSCII